MDSTAFRIFGFNIEESFTDLKPEVVFYSRKAFNRCNIEGFNLSKPFENYSFPVGGIISDYTQGTALEDYSKDYNVVQIGAFKGYVRQFIVETTETSDEILKSISEGVDKIYAEATSLPLHLEAQYLDDFMYQSLAKPRNTLRLIALFMFVSLIISALGMFAMCTYFTNQNAKSIAIRKIMGSTINEIVKKYMRLFIIMTAVASIVATPIAYFAAQRYLSTYPNRMELALWIFVFAIAVAFIITIASILGQILHAAKANPVNYLKSE